MKPWFIIVIFLVGCASSTSALQTPVGKYYTIGFNSSSHLGLNEDGTYRLDYQVVNCDLSGAGGWETGHWRLAGDVIELMPDPKYAWQKIPMYARLRLTKKDGKRQLICDVKGTFAYQKFGFDEEEQNQSSQPMRAGGPHG